jgi:anaerobic C4-dicarboxylate transporter
MTETNNKLRHLLKLAVKAFILASVVAVILPIPQYARSLSDEKYIIWLARLIWVLMLTVGVSGVLLLFGFLASKLQNKTRQTG